MKLETQRQHMKYSGNKLEQAMHPPPWFPIITILCPDDKVPAAMFVVSHQHHHVSC